VNGLVSLLSASLVIVVVIAAYLLPTLIAWLRHASELAVVVIVNVALGWTVLGWWVALVLALRRTASPVVQVVSQVNMSAPPPRGHYAKMSSSQTSGPPASGRH